ncbi:hypothetical protein PINS_up003259 [Pythium insidiosum]|nr:hypothetical protein PINS_up003259 [Pythium insidiosum]
MYPMLASPSTTSTASRSTAASLVATAMHMRRAQRLGVDAKSLAVVDEQERCRYPSKFCGNKRAVKSTGRLHRFCEHHRRRANQNQKRWSQMRRAAPQPTTPLGSPSRSLLSPASSCLSSPLSSSSSSSSVHTTPIDSPVTTDWIAQHAASTSEWSTVHASLSAVSAACHLDAWCASPVCPASPSHPADLANWSFVDATSSESDGSSSDCDSELSSDEITTLLALLSGDEDQQCASFVSSGVDAVDMFFASVW